MEKRTKIYNLMKNDPLWNALNKQSKVIDKIFNGKRTTEAQKNLEDLLTKVVAEAKTMRSNRNKETDFENDRILKWKSGIHGRAIARCRVP